MKKSGIFPKKVWIDTDPAFGDPYGDCDDGYAMIALFHSPKVEVVGVSTVFANTNVANAFQKAKTLIDDYLDYHPFYQGDRRPPVYWGAEGPLQLNHHKKEEPHIWPVQTQASEKLRDFLSGLEAEEKLTIVAIGALTNIATVVLLNPELAEKIETIIVVAGRNSTRQRFYFGTEQAVPFPDLNFDNDVDAFRVLLQSNIGALVLAGVEVSRQLWIMEEDLEHFKSSPDPDIRYMAEQSADWLSLWRSFGNEVDNEGRPILADGKQVPVNGFNPYDVLAASYAIGPDWFIGKHWPAAILIDEDHDVPYADAQSPKAYKNFLVASPNIFAPRHVIYLYGTKNNYSREVKELLYQHQF